MPTSIMPQGSESRAITPPEEPEVDPNSAMKRLGFLAFVIPIGVLNGSYRTLGEDKSATTRNRTIYPYRLAAGLAGGNA